MRRFRSGTIGFLLAVAISLIPSAGSSHFIPTHTVTFVGISNPQFTFASVGTAGVATLGFVTGPLRVECLSIETNGVLGSDHLVRARARSVLQADVVYYFAFNGFGTLNGSWSDVENPSFACGAAHNYPYETGAGFIAV